MIKFSRNIINYRDLVDSLESFNHSSTKSKTLYISTCQQLIRKGSKKNIYNIIIGDKDAFIPIKYLNDYFGDTEIITLNVHDQINYIKSKTNCNISIKQGGLLFVNKLAVIDNVKFLGTVLINSIKLLSELESHPDSIIKKIEKLQETADLINYNNPQIRSLMMDTDTILANIFLSGLALERLSKLSSFGVIDQYVTNEEILRITNLQESILRIKFGPRGFSENSSFQEFDVDIRYRSAFRIADIFTCYEYIPYIKITGTVSRQSNDKMLKQTKNCLNYIKYMGKLDEITDRLEYVKLSII
jgi:hypothetical protein